MADPTDLSGEPPRAASAISGHLDTRTAGMEVADRLHDALGGAADLVLIFASYHHHAALPDAAAGIRRTLGAPRTLAVTAEAVIGGDEEREGIAGLSAVAMRLPGARLTSFVLTPEKPLPLRDPAALAKRIGWGEESRGVLLLADPFTTPISRLLPALAAAGPGGGPIPVVGGLASGASQAGHNVLVLDDEVIRAGGIGITIDGPFSLDVVVSQGCRPIGRPHVATRVEGQRLLELGGRPALEIVRDETEALTPADRALLEGGLLLGHVLDEQGRPFGRGDFLVRSLLGVDTKREALLVGEVPRIGQTVQLHVRDAVTAEEDLQLLLDAQVMHEAPFAGLLFSCNGRGARLFGRAGRDIEIIHERMNGLPVAGFFAAGEIGPIGGTSFLHGQTAVLAMFR